MAQRNRDTDKCVNARGWRSWKWLFNCEVAVLKSRHRQKWNFSFQRHFPAFQRATLHLHSSSIFWWIDSVFFLKNKELGTRWSRVRSRSTVRVRVRFPRVGLFWFFFYKKNRLVVGAAGGVQLSHSFRKTNFNSGERYLTQRHILYFSVCSRIDIICGQGNWPLILSSRARVLLI